MLASSPAPLGCASPISHVLVVCTGNICRSPFGEYALRARLTGSGITVASAGVYALEGSAMDHVMHEQLGRRLGLDASGFVAHQVTRDDVQKASLIVVMSRSQRAYLTQEWPTAHNKTLLLSCSAELEQAHARTSAAPTEPLDTRTVRAVAQRVYPHAHDIPDPYRKDPALYAQVAQLVDDHSARLARLLHPQAPHN